MLALGGGVGRVANGVDGGGDSGVRVGAAVGTGVTAAGVIGTGVEVPIGVTAGFSGWPFFFWPRYHPVPPTITKPTIATAMRIDLRQDEGGIGAVAIDGFSG